MTGGGTGGHVNPALAIANTIKENEPDSEIAFVGTPRGIENKLVPAAGYKLCHVDVMGIRRSLSPKNIKALYLALMSPLKAKKIIKEFRPDIVIGTGGSIVMNALVGVLADHFGFDTGMRAIFITVILLGVLAILNAVLKMRCPQKA